MKKYQLGLYEKSMPDTLSWQEKLEAAKAAGFDHLEISIDEKDEKLARLDWSEEEKRALMHAIIATGVPVSSMCLSGHRRFPLGSHDPAVRARGLEIMSKAIDFAVFFGIRIIQLAGYDVYYEEGDARSEQHFFENLQKSVEMAAKKSVTLGFETMETPFMDTVTKAMHYVERVGSPYLGVYPDIGNLKNASLVHGSDLLEDIRRGRGSIFATHLKETIPGHYREIPFGTGHTEYVPCLEVLKELGVRYFTAEFWYVGSEEWLRDLAFASKFLREKLDRIFV